MQFLTTCFLIQSCKGLDLVYLTSEDKDFYIKAKSSEIVVKSGDSFVLDCQTNNPWHICHWQQPNLNWCSFLATSKYDKFCNSNDRINHMIGHLDFKSAADTNCFITITHADPMDSGIWKCFVAEGVSTSPVSDSVRVTVLHPAELEPIPSEIIIPRTQSETAEIACNATVIGDLEPQLTWLADHREVTACKIIREPEHDRTSDGRWVLSAILPLKNMPNNTHLVCRSKQTFPNGTVWLEQVIVTQLHFGQKDTFAFEHLKDMEVEEQHMNVAGTIITTFFVICTLIGIFLICYARHKKAWCYSTDGKSNNSPSPNYVPSAPQAEDGSLLHNTDSTAPIVSAEDVPIDQPKIHNTRTDEQLQQNANGEQSGSSSVTSVRRSMANPRSIDGPKLHRDPLSFVNKSNPNMVPDMEVIEIGNNDSPVRISTDSLNTRYAELISAPPATTYLRSFSVSHGQDFEPIYAEIKRKSSSRQPANFPELDKRKSSHENEYVTLNTTGD